MTPALNITAELDFGGVFSDLSLHFATRPMHRIQWELDEAGIQTLATRYADRIFRTSRSVEDGKLGWSTLLLRFEGDTFAVFRGEGYNHAWVIAPTGERAEAVHAELHGVLVPASEAAERAGKPFFYLLRFECNDFSTNRVDTLPERVDDDFLRLCYGDDVLPWIENFTATTRARAGGITLLDGMPGTGKTSLITQLMHRLRETHVFYVLPTTQNEALASPEMTPFWQRQNARHPDRVKVIIMEDADRLLWRRGTDNREAVASLLNIADGLLGRMLRLHVVCSVNSALEDLDPAILRPGRLFGHRHFAPLGREAAVRLAELKGVEFTPDVDVDEFPLAEVLNPPVFEPASGGSRARVEF